MINLEFAIAKQFSETIANMENSSARCRRYMISEVEYAPLEKTQSKQFGFVLTILINIAKRMISTFLKHFEIWSVTTFSKVRCNEVDFTVFDKR